MTTLTLTKKAFFVKGHFQELISNGDCNIDLKVF